MILRPAIVYRRVGVDRAFFMLRIADEVHAGWVVEQWGHCLKMKGEDTEKGRSGWIYGLEVGKRVCVGYGEGETGYNGTSEQ
jgi:hypothetical protein